MSSKIPHEVLSFHAGEFKIFRSEYTSQEHKTKSPLTAALHHDFSALLLQMESGFFKNIYILIWGFFATIYIYQTALTTTQKFKKS